MYPNGHEESDSSISGLDSSKSGEGGGEDEGKDPATNISPNNKISTYGDSDDNEKKGVLTGEQISSYGGGIIDAQGNITPSTTNPNNSSEESVFNLDRMLRAFRDPDFASKTFHACGITLIATGTGLMEEGIRAIPNPHPAIKAGGIIATGVGGVMDAIGCGCLKIGNYLNSKKNNTEGTNNYKR